MNAISLVLYIYMLHLNINKKNYLKLNKLMFCRMNDIKAPRLSKRKALGKRIACVC